MPFFNEVWGGHVATFLSFYCRCEHTLSNSAGEAQALIDAARSFLDADLVDRELCVPGFQEHLTASINCYSHAIRVYLQIIYFTRGLNHLK